MDGKSTSLIEIETVNYRVQPSTSGYSKTKFLALFPVYSSKTPIAKNSVGREGWEGIEESVDGICGSSF